MLKHQLMLSPEQTEFISQLPVFAALSAQALGDLAAMGHVEKVPVGTTVFPEGELGTRMLVVFAGELAIAKQGRDGQSVHLATLQRGDVCGEMALIDIQPRSAAAITRGPAELIFFAYSDLAKFYEKDPLSYTILVLNIAREISRRLRRADTLLADIHSSARPVSI